MNLSELNNLDFNNIGSWPAAARGVAIGFIAAAVLGLGYWFDTRDQLDQLERAKAREVQLKGTFEQKQATAANLDAYQQQMREIEESFGAMLRQLPSKTEVAELLVDISQTGLASGLEFKLFKPDGENPVEFYAELPIQINVTGGYHDFGRFVSGVAALPRIVTLHDINISSDGKGNKLGMNMTAKTYRYLDEEEMMEIRAAQAPNNQQRRRR